MRDDDLKTKSLTPSYNLDLKPLGSCNSQPLKKLKKPQLFAYVVQNR